MTRSLWLTASAALLITAIGVSFVVGYVSRQRQEMFIYGPSMAETFCGRHGKLTCPTCQHVLRFDLEALEFPERIVCPNCGKLVPIATPHDVVPGERVSVEKLKSPPQRFDIVAFEVPAEPNMLGVKRIIGLPGELVSIQAGEIFINGRLWQKDWPQQRELAVVVNDDFGIGMHLPVSRWSAPLEGSGWYELRSENVQRQFVFRPQEHGEDIAWLTYRHGRSFDSPGQAAPSLLDNDSYNQSLARELNDVFDYHLTFTLRKPSGSGSRIFIAAHDGWQRWQVEITDEIVRLRRDDVEVASALRHVWKASTSVLLSICDEKLRVSLNDEELLSVDTRPASAPLRQLPTDFLAVGAVGPSRVLCNLKLTRDIYCLDPQGTSAAWSMDKPLGPDEYFVLGDNPPVSVDSRQFGPVKASAIRGKVAPDKVQ